MQVDKFTNGGDQGIDELLKQSFLDLDQNNPVNDELFDMASQNVFGTEWPGQVDAQKEAQITKISKISKWPWYLSGIGAVGIIATAAVFFLNDKNGQSNQNNKLFTEIDNEKTSTYNSPLTDNASNDEKQEKNKAAQNAEDADKTQKNGVGSKSGDITVDNELAVQNTQVNETMRAIDPNPLVTAQVITPTVISNSGNAIQKSLMPALSDEQKSETKKEIQKLIFETTSNFVYNYVPISGALRSGYNQKAWQKSFNMKSTEVTVKEYMIFLNDLIMNGKEAEYERAKPKLEEVFGTNMSEEDKKFFTSYFSSPHYKNYPMVFITSEAATMYCAWLQELIIKNSNGKFLNVEVRLPYESEWERAATGGNSKAEVGTRNGKIRNGIFHNKTLEANYKETQRSNFMFLTNDDELNINAGDKKDKEKFNYFTCNVHAYSPNAYGLFNMAGNVSEMVIDKKGKVMTKGGNWNSSVEYLKIKDPDFVEFPMGAEASPYIGFRPVINLK